MGQKQSGRSGVIVVLGLALAAGCHQFPRRGSTPGDTAEVAPRIGPAQAADVQFALGRTLEKRGAEEQARAAYAEAVKQDPKRIDALVRLAVLCDRQGRFRESEELYRRALAACPRDADLRCNRGYSLYLQQRWAEAEQSLRRAIALRSDHLRAHNNLGAVLARSGREAEALEEFRRGGCSSADAQGNLAVALMLGGNWSEARQHYEHALAANPSSPSARKGLKDLTALMKRTQPAEQGLAATAMTVPAQLPELVQVGHTAPATLAKPLPAKEDWVGQEDLPDPVVEPAGGAPSAGLERCGPR